MTSRISAIVLCLCCSASFAETAYKSQDGNLYVIRDSETGPKFERVTIVDLTVRTPPDGEDKFGLIAASQKAADSVADYPRKSEHSAKLAAYYTGLADSVEAGKIPKDKLAIAVNEVFRLATNPDSDDWSEWKARTTEAFANAPINTPAEAAHGLRDIGKGLMIGNNLQAVDWEKLIKFFIEHILPLIIDLIGGA